MLEDKLNHNHALKESFYHALLIQQHKISIGSDKAERDLRLILSRHDNLESYYQSLNLPSIKELSQPFRKLIRTYERLEMNLGLLSITSKSYPLELKDVDIATPLLYYRGNQELLNSKVMAVIGTRRLEDPQDISDGKKIVERLVNANYTILSGLALGCDTLAHKTAIDFNGKTIAVLGTPLDKIYPPENADYQDFMGREHLLVSQYPIGITTYPSHFAHRDKTQVHLSEGVVVIRADDKSGAQHAIKEAAKRNKPIYALKNNYGKGYSWLHTYQDNIKVPGEKSGENICSKKNEQCQKRQGDHQS
ncbi:DNA-processing protein DprA [Candidatus Woesearchaeota archaeon]|nr:DNA-processing protein DprA [Candidatus Woesearchaeota archaeon]